MLNDFYHFAQYVNEQLTARYLARANKDADFLLNINQMVMEEGAVHTMLDLNRYIDHAANGNLALAINYPEIPQKESPKTALILALSLVLGFMIAAFYILCKQAFYKHRTMQQHFGPSIAANTK